MRIYSMTATFGKLEHQRLELQPGLNVIEAPNEWGKSTWCAFLVTMLYGLDTRERSKKHSLADKERFAPWSGSPMSGRIDLCWQGRDITIERGTKGRIPMGELRVYETETGIAVEGIDASNCGEMLLGVERSVFARAGFIRGADMPVTQDEELRRRLNALVTTGDDSGEAELLGQKLKELKNRCRYNRRGLLPEAEQRRDRILEKLSDREALSRQDQRLRQQRTELEQQIAALRDHRSALRYAAAQEDAQRVAAASKALEQAEADCRTAEAACAGQPDRETACAAMERQADLRQQWERLLEQERQLPADPELPQIPEAFRGMVPAAAVCMAEADKATMESMRWSKGSRAGIPWAIGLGAVVAGVIAMVLELLLPGVILIGLGLCGLLVGVVMFCVYKNKRKAMYALRMDLCRRYGSDDPEQWLVQANRYRIDMDRYRQRTGTARSQREALAKQRQALTQQQEAAPGTDYAAVVAAWDALAEAKRRRSQVQIHFQTVQAMAKTAQPAAVADGMDLTEQETEQLLGAHSEQLRQIQLKLGQCQGQMALLGDPEVLGRELEAVQKRIDQLQVMDAALSHGLDALEEARTRLQRRFAPRITRQASLLFARLTGGRYDRVTMTEDLSVLSGAKDEDTLRSHLWRSEGTADQLYLALRLAVAKELTPDAPLILDDALIRFDDERLRNAMKLLKEEAGYRQVILFSCQGREKQI